MSTLTVPGKVFLIGEYHVLSNGSAMFAALRPGYSFSNESGSRFHAHPESPLGKYLTENEISLDLRKDEKSSSFGMGGSTAELIAGIFFSLERLPETKRIWAWYREHFPKASGSDLVVQMEAIRTKAPLFHYHLGEAGVLGQSKLPERIHVLQVKPDQKLKTHEALEKPLPALPAETLEAYVKAVEIAFEQNDLNGLKAFSQYADTLHSFGIETERAHSTRKAFEHLPGVVGVKGSGAGLHDVFLVAGDVSAADLQQVAEKFDLISLGRLSELLW